LVPIIAFIAGLAYDINNEQIPDIQPKPKYIWCELPETDIIVIREKFGVVSKRYTGLLS